MSTRQAGFAHAKLALIFISAALLFGCAGVTADDGHGGQRMLTLQEMLDGGHWQPIAVAGLIISMSFVAFGYMLAELLRLPTLNAWAKGEFYEVLMSMFLLGSVFFFVALSGNLGKAFTYGENHIEYGMLYLENMKTLLELELYPLLLLLDVVVGNFATWNFSVPFEVSAVAIIIGTSPMAGLSLLSNALVFMLDTVGIFITVVVAQMEFLSYAETFALSLFLPIGIVLRTFPITRNTGSTLIALAITAYFVYPLTLAFNEQVFDVAFVPISNGFAAGMGDTPLRDPGSLQMNFEYPDQILAQFNYYDTQAPGAQLTPEGTSPNIATGAPNERLGSLQTAFQSKARVNAINPTDNPKFSFLQASAGQLVVPVSGWASIFFDYLFLFYGPVLAQAAVLAIILPIFDIIICITFFRGLSTSIGGEAQIMGLTKII
jgi:hypothetical protein